MPRRDFARGGERTMLSSGQAVDKMQWVGVDLGGSWVRVVLSDSRGVFLGKVRERVDTGSAAAISAQISRLTRSLCSQHRTRLEQIRGVGVASAGPLKQAEGVLIRPPNIPFELVPLTRPISRDLGIQACLINDCAGAALGESVFGAAKGLDNSAYVTLSTGIGCGAIVNGILSLGKDGNAHEVGHFVIDLEGRLKCSCGRPGHWEAYCSGRNIPNFVRMRLQEMSSETVKNSLLFKRFRGDFSNLKAADLFASAKERDRVSVKLVHEIGVLNAMGFANVVNAYDPSLITVGGAVTLENQELVLPPIKRHVGKYALNRIPRILVTPLGDDVVLYGAVATAMRYLS